MKSEKCFRIDECGTATKHLEIWLKKINLRPLHKALTRARCATDNATPKRASINATAVARGKAFAAVYLLKFLSLFIISLGLPVLLFAQGNQIQIPGLNNSPLVSQAANAPIITSRAAVMLDARTGTILYAKNAYEEISPASLTKLMTMHLLQNEIYAGRVSPHDIIPITSESWAINQPPRSSLMFLGPGQTVKLGDILLGLAVSSGNDASVAAALSLAPTVADFAILMNNEARRLGLKNTYFVEPSGVSELNMSCAADFAFFSRYYINKHPNSLKNYHSVREFSYPKAENVAPAYRNDPRTISQNNRNSLLRSFPGVDGLKTGYLDISGFNIVLTAERNHNRFIAVILGAPAGPGGERIREEDSSRLLSWAFDNFKTVYPEIGEIPGTRLWKGKENIAYFRLIQADPLAPNSTIFTSPVQRANSLWVSYEYIYPLKAPLPANFPAGTLIISDEYGELHRVQLLTTREYEKANIFKRMWHNLRLLFHRNK